MNPLKDFRIHYKEKPYRVLGSVVHTETREELTLYEALYLEGPKNLFVRPTLMFEDDVSVLGTRVGRFRKVSSLSEITAQIWNQIWVPDFTRLDYLKNGDRPQREAFEVLNQSKIMERLATFDPILVGTYPIHLQVKGSDLDVLCSAKNPGEVERALAGIGAYTKAQVNFEDQPAATVFHFDELSIPIEVFAQATPSLQQRGYRHLVNEAKLLRIGGEPVRSEIIALKNKGLKTESAFAEVFGLPGDPYQAMLLALMNNRNQGPN